MATGAVFLLQSAFSICCRLCFRIYTICLFCTTW